MQSRIHPKLVQNGFVVVPHDAEQFFQIYESSHYGMRPRIPNFITSDCILQLYHLFYDFTLRVIEFEQLLPAVEDLTREMFSRSQAQFEEIDDHGLKEACRRNVLFFGVAVRLLELEGVELPKEIISIVEAELEKIEEHNGRVNSGIFPFQHDYTQYVPRGHYTRSDDFKRFFRVMIWYGQTGFPFEYDGKRTEQQILQAQLITQTLFQTGDAEEQLIDLWDKLYSIITLYVGASDDLNARQFYDLMKEVYGRNISLKVLADRKKLDSFYEKAVLLPQPRIVGQAFGIPSGLQFRFMGQRFLPDSYIMQKLVNWPQRPFPKGLDVMSVLGSEHAAVLLDELYREPAKWDEYLPRREKLTREFAEHDENLHYSTLYYGWLYVLRALIIQQDESLPGFMQNTAWTEKQLNTSLASWAEMRHDVILYGKPSMAQGGNGEDERRQPKGYVEPNPEFFNRLLKLVRLNRKILLDNEMLPERVSKPFDKYEDLLQFLSDVSGKELAGTMLSDTEYEGIRSIGRKLEDLSLRLVELDRSLQLHWTETGEKVRWQNYSLRAWYEVKGPDKDLACIADVHTSGDSCLEEAVGHANIIYVIVPIEGELHLTRGGVFSYYEFTYPAAHRLTDEAWQEMIKRERAPEPPSWTSSFMAE